MVKKEKIVYIILSLFCVQAFVLDAKPKKQNKKQSVLREYFVQPPMRHGLFTLSVDNKGKSAAPLFLKKPTPKTDNVKTQSWSEMFFRKNPAFETLGAVTHIGVLPTMVDLLCWTVVTRQLGITAPINRLPNWSPRI